MTKNELNTIIKESLRDWFKKEKWVRISSSGNIAGPCGTSKNKKNPDRCLPKAKAQSLTKSQRAATAQKKKKAGKKGKTVVKNTKKATVQKEVRVYGDTRISDMLEKLARSIGREKFAMHILYDLPKDIKRDILDALDFKKGGIYNMDTIYADAQLEEDESLEEFSLPKFDVVKPIINQFLGGIEKAGKKLFNIVKREGKQTIVLIREIAEYVIKGEKPNAAEQKKINKQLLDIGFLGLLGVTGNIPISAFAILYWILQESGVAKEFLKLDENLDPSYKHDGKAAPYGSGYRPAKKITKEDITNLIVGLLEERKPISEKKKKKKDDRCTRLAKQKYDTWPSAYASGAVVRCRRGEIWKKK